VTEAETAVLERLARIETDLTNLRAESNAIRGTLHDLIKSALADHSAAISRLAAAHDHRTGAWWSLYMIAAAAILLIGAGAWLLEHRVDIIIRQ
jgi:hypothetical protein